MTNFKNYLVAGILALFIAGWVGACAGGNGVTDPGLQLAEGEDTTTTSALIDQENESGAVKETASASTGTESGTANTGAVIAASAPRSMNNQSAFLWQGFRHEWLRTVLGFKVPHRISKFDNFIFNENHQLEGADWTGSGVTRFGQSTGVDGNFMKPEGFHAAISGPGLYVNRGSISFTWTDNGNGATYPQAKSDLSAAITVNLNNAELGYGNLDQYTAIMRGIALNSSCDNAKQPAGESCNSNGMWPFKMYFSIGSCVKNSFTLSCPVTVKIYRAWTPNKGGLPGIEEKPFNDKLDFTLKIYYSVVAGNAADFAFTPAAEFSTSGTGHDNDPKSGVRTIYGQSSNRYAKAATAITAFGFEFSKYGSADKNNHLGRYIGTVQFQVNDASYNALTGAIGYGYSQQVWLPDTVVNSNVKYFTKITALQFNGTSVKNRSAGGSLCINSNGAPLFSVWKNCGSGDKGPERSQHDVLIAVP